jgi:hypothetical protein
MRPDVGEEMSRQPSLPSLTIEGTLVRTSRLTRAENRHSTNRAPSEDRVGRARTNRATKSRLLSNYKRLTNTTP